MLYLSNQLVKSSPMHAKWAGLINADRAFFEAEEVRLGARLANSSAIIPRDAWLTLDGITMRVLRNDEGQAYMTDLMALSKPVDIGKLAHLTRAASDQGQATVSMTGQKAIPMDKTKYLYRGTPLPIFDTGYGREWREWATLQSENFDALADDQEASVATLQRRIADYVLNGDTSVKVDTYSGYGIRTNPLSKSINLGSAAGGANINLTTATPQQIENFVITVLGKALDDNNLTGRKLNLYISPEIGRSWDRPYSGPDGSKEGSIRDVLLKNRRIGKITDTFKLTGNEFFAFIPDPQFIRPLVGLAVSTVAIPRTKPRDNYNFMVSGALGIEVRADYEGRTGVFYSVQVN